MWNQNFWNSKETKLLQINFNFTLMKAQRFFVCLLLLDLSSKVRQVRWWRATQARRATQAQKCKSTLSYLTCLKKASLFVKISANNKNCKCQGKLIPSKGHCHERPFSIFCSHEKTVKLYFNCVTEYFGVWAITRGRIHNTSFSS